ncbi:uroporphyrinogen-III synthase [Bacillus xiamenensis]|uniref:Uroporphyrinogen-III synthase n=1 Tax=Bacillus xiamenensis TaxID=1178537 RepID=A0AAC9IN20_9BACI|nr:MULTISPECIES: uroporphyrinogen-III synthase [Bacillus]AOZ89833.1 uroporphyrinogen-III synthase [Bacillus xiamenensis]EKF35711.1 uroporphyrinogen III cosynthase [Bacillus xiamenensis]MBG9910959.1 uroporphyrinogen-III synthase [Bacillus xiamenensis]MCW1835966.1 uroporphyrinogen-III synthase [Bacillus xiamenensis]MCY9575607.1 uroporphyrinogen-III synthase [Bacillus xiamenensis]
MTRAKSLYGQTVLVTRNERQAGVFRQKIEALNGRAVLTSLIRFEPTLTKEKAEAFLQDLKASHWLVFTSVNGASFFLNYIEEHRLHQSLSHLKVAAVGEKTSAYLKQHGFKVDVVPEQFIAEELADALIEHVQPKERVFVAKGRLSRDVVKKTLVPLGIEVKEWILYETVKDEDGIAALKSAMMEQSFDFITFTSSSTVHSFMHAMEADVARLAASDTCFVTIGPLTKEALLQYGISSETPDTYTIDGMLDLMCRLSERKLNH